MAKKYNVISSHSVILGIYDLNGLVRYYNFLEFSGYRYLFGSTRLTEDL